MEVIAAIDVLGEEAVRLRQGDYGRATAYGEPIALAERFRSAPWVHLVDLDGARSGAVRPDLVRAVAEAASPARVQASGGIRSVADAKALLSAGAARVVVGTAAWTLLDELVAALGERLVVALDVREGVVRTAGWTESSLPVDDAVDLCVAAGVRRLLCTAIERDGTLAGPDVELVRRVVERSGLPTLAAGGIRNDADLDALELVGAEAAIVGRALLKGRLTLRLPGTPTGAEPATPPKVRRRIRLPPDAARQRASYRCAMAETLDSRALRAISDAVVAIASEQRFEPVLQKLAHAARELAGARYAAIGVPDGEGGFSHFFTSGMTEKQWDAIGALPRQHGLLGAMLENARSHRTDDISAHPRFEGWPNAHPNMRSFLGVPIVSKGDVIGAFYLTDKKGGRRAVFTNADQELIETLAAHAAVAIENARLSERSRELTVIEERNRLARELHDAVTQSLFSVVLTAEAAALLVDSDPEQAKEQLATVRELARAAMAEMRSLIFELRPADLGADGLIPTLRKHVDVLRRVYGREIELDIQCERALRPSVEQEVFRIAQEALSNAIKHANAKRLAVRLATPDGRLELTVTDDGSGFEPGSRDGRKHLGLVSMRERAQELGGELRVESKPGTGTTVTLEVALDPGPDR